VLPSQIAADVLGNVTATGNVIAGHFLGNGALLTGLTEYVLPANVTVTNLNAGNAIFADHGEISYVNAAGVTSTNVSAFNVYTNYVQSANILTGEFFSNSVVASGNVTAGHFIGNGSLLTGVPILNSSGMIEQTNLDGYLTVPQGYVANAEVRLALGGGALPVGSLARQVDDGNSYLLTATPSNVDVNWLTFTGLNFPVNTVFGRIGDVLSTYGDYFDSQIELAANVGPVPAGNSVAEALSYLSGQIAAIWARIGP
jgi:hypothetical protein